MNNNQHSSPRAPATKTESAPSAAASGIERLRQLLGPDAARRTLKRRLDGLLQRGNLVALPNP